MVKQYILRVVCPTIVSVIVIMGILILGAAMLLSACSGEVSIKSEPLVDEEFADHRILQPAEFVDRFGCNEVYKRKDDHGYIYEYRQYYGWSYGGNDPCDVQFIFIPDYKQIY